MEKMLSKNTHYGGVDLVAGRSFAGSAGRIRSLPLGAAEPGSNAEFQQRIQELDSPCYETRRLAAERLEHWLGMPEMAAMLAEQFQQLVVQPELPFEVRWRISVWRTRLPSVKSEPPQSVSAEELERLVRQLDDDSYAVRGRRVANDCGGWRPASTWPSR